MNRNGKPSRRYPVDGRMMTITEIAGMLGVQRNTLYAQLRRLKVEPRALVQMYRDNQLSVGDWGERWMVDYHWTTVRQAAKQLGISRNQLYKWMSRNRPATLADAVAHYRKLIRAGKRGAGRKPKWHEVGGRWLTIAEAAELCGVTEQAFRSQMSRRKASPQQVTDHYERIRREKAEKAILGILLEARNGGKRDE